MLPEKQNNLSDLQKKLAGLDELPGEMPADIPALWEKLHQRLENKPRKSFAFLYWAAASLLLAVSIVFMQQHTQEKEFVAVSKYQKSKSVRPHGVLKTNIAHHTANDKIGIKVRKDNAAVKLLQMPDASDPENAYVQKDTILTTAITENKLQQTTTQSIAQPDTVLQTLAEIPVKKLKVVHINNLHKSNSEKITAPATSLIAAKNLSSDYQESASNISFSRNNSDEIIKIKLTPTN